MLEKSLTKALLRWGLAFIGNFPSAMTASATDVFWAGGDLKYLLENLAFLAITTAGTRKAWSLRSYQRSPAYTARWKDLLECG